jgi:hypothetical protein
MSAAHQDEPEGDATPTPLPPPDSDLDLVPPQDETPTPTMTIPPPPSPPSPSPSPPTVTPTPFFGDPCWGDEQITYVPDSPRTSNELVIAVTSSRPHPYPRLAGTEATKFVGEKPGQLGHVWEWSIQPTWPGRHQYTFYVDSTVPCQKVEILIRRQFFTRTPTPTKTPKPENMNGNES